MESFCYFLIHECSTFESESGTVNHVLAVVDDLTEKEAVKVGEALETAIVSYNENQKFSYEPYYLFKGDGAPEYLWYLAQAKESAKLYQACENPAEVTPWVFVKLTHRLADCIREQRSNSNGKKSLPEYPTGKIEVYDKDNDERVVIDLTHTQRWGPVVDYDYPMNIPLGYLAECTAYATLHRYPSGHWVILYELLHHSGSVNLREAIRLDDYKAVDWLLRKGFDLPADVANLASQVMFSPGIPTEKEEVGQDLKETNTASGSKDTATCSQKTGWEFAPGKAVYNGHDIELRGKPREILETLVNSSHAVTMHDIIDEVWQDSEHGIKQKTFRGYLSDLRKILRDSLSLALDFDPIPNVERGKKPAWRIHDSLR